MTTEPSEEQSAVIGAKTPDILVIAGPGSGKTATLVWRIVEDIKRGSDPDKMICLTFTQAGASEARKRLEAAGITKLGFIGTLHAFAILMISRHGASLGYKQAVTVIDEESADSIVRQITTQLRVKAPLSEIKEWKGRMSATKVAAVVAAHYLKYLRKRSAVDFDTALAELCRLAENGALPDFDALYVDEYQDSGPWDGLIYEQIKAKIKFRVGDPDQAIYGFRGARMENIMNLADTPGVQLCYLQNNFRSGDAIIKAALKVIKCNATRLDKGMKCMTDEPSQVRRLDVENPLEEMQMITNTVRAAGAANFSTIAVLTRYNARATSIVQALATAGIPVQQPKRRSDTEELRVAIGALNALSNPDDDIGAAAWIATTLIDGQNRLGAMAAAVATTATRYLMKALQVPADGPLGAKLDKMGVTNQARGLIAEHWDGEPATTALTLCELMNTETTEGTSAGVYVGTLHSAKGREWKTVIMAGSEDATIPGKKKGEELEAERRLFYVGMTRARRNLIFTSCARITDEFKNSVIDTVPSRFMVEAL